MESEMIGEITEKDLLRMFPTHTQLHRITRKQIKQILDAGEYRFVLDWGWYGNIWGGRTEISYDFAFWHNSNSWDRDAENRMAKQETIDYVYQHRADIEDIRDKGGLFSLSRARVLRT